VVDRLQEKHLCHARPAAVSDGHQRASSVFNSQHHFHPVIGTRTGKNHRGRQAIQITLRWVASCAHTSLGEYPGGFERTSSGIPFIVRVRPMIAWTFGTVSVPRASEITTRWPGSREEQGNFQTAGTRGALQPHLLNSLGFCIRSDWIL
jgi:hypothetical protein